MMARICVCVSAIKVSDISVRVCVSVISAIRFSPDGTVLALGSQDCTVYFYTAADFGCKAKCRGHKVCTPHTAPTKGRKGRGCLLTLFFVN